ncbi:MAG: endonuclease/exonuclease/phosphatase family protein [Jatrophihabitantaceae bacterium]
MRVATFNILHGRSPVDGRVDLDRFIDAVRQLDADVLALQEVDRDQPRSELADLTAVAAQAMGAVSYRFAAAVAGTPGAAWIAATGTEQPGSAAYGIALLSRYPVRSWQVIRLPWIPFRFPMWLREPAKVLVVKEEPRVALTGVVSSPHGEITVVNTHLSFVPGWNVVQLRRLRRNLRPQPEPVLLMGDLNLSDSRPARFSGYRPLASAPTFPADAPVRQLDHILRRGRIGPARTVHTPLLPLSDHRPLVVDL